MQRVFDNGMVAHVWAQGKQSSGYSHNRNFSFDGARLISYSTTIARFVKPEELRKGYQGRVALLTSRSYSMTTEGKHKNAARRALLNMPGVRYFTVDDIGDAPPYGKFDAVRAFRDLLNEYKEEVARMKRRVSKPPSEWHRDSLAILIEIMGEFVQAFVIPARLAQATPNANADFADVCETWERRYNTPEKRAAREARERAREAAREIERKAQYERMTESREAWIAGGERGYSIYGRAFSDENGGALLRVKGDVLETSWGADVPLPHAVRAFKFIAECRERGQEFRPNGRTIHVGHFTVDHISADGTLRAGCHVIHWPEIERIARSLGLLEQAAG